jgi:hypothetical protein
VSESQSHSPILPRQKNATRRVGFPSTLALRLIEIYKKTQKKNKKEKKNEEESLIHRTRAIDD